LFVSVDHPEVVNDYRRAHGACIADAAEPLSVEEARRAFIAYRSLFSELLGDDNAGPGTRTRTRDSRDEHV
jgi:hypothetical protein